MPAFAATIPKIVAVDEDLASLQIVRFILLEENVTCELSIFNAVDDAERYLATQPVDLILLDLMAPHGRMEESKGLRLFGRLRATPANAQTPVILLANSTEMRVQIEAFNHGAADFIGKPIQAPVLKARVERILDIQHLRKTLEERNGELEKTNGQLDELMSVVSHDLLSPLSSIEIICQLLNDSLSELEKSPHSPATLVTRIMNQSQLARRLVKNVLDLNKIEDGVLVAAPTFFNARQLLVSCTQDEQPILQAKRLAFDLELPDSDVVGFGDREMISQAVRNLLGNAVKFAGSRIAVCGRVVREPGPPDSAPLLEIAVTDDGPGIAESERTRIFEKYASSDRSTGGNGLGLYIARKVVDLHAGRIWVEPTPSGGASFRIRLPLVFQSADFPDLSEVAEASVVVVSPQKSTAQKLEGVLVEGGMVNVCSKVTGRVDLGDERAKRPALVIVDLQQPDFNVVNLMRAMRDVPRSTAWLLLAHEDDFRAVDPLLPQPYQRLLAPLNPLELLHRVNAILQAAAGAGDVSPGTGRIDARH
ncbi:MAG: hybrid sensor histidine kinase/response regulator [Candidatus Lambdaproteobacteria bacterium]|nr:hybrid sensor histidine kinase/response regulator [Candidatus Lambdaproteobacteria bacterium]